MKKTNVSFLVIFGLFIIIICIFYNKIGNFLNSFQLISSQVKNISYVPDTITKYINCTKQYEVKGVPNKDKFFNKMDCNPQLDQIHFWESQKYFKNFDSIPVKIAIIDGYFNTNHPDIKASVYKTYSLNDPNCYPYDSKKTECSNVLPPANVQVKSDNINALNHGTIISGVIAGRGTVGQGVTGINPSAQLILISQGNKTGNNDEWYIKTLQVAIDMKPDIISISWPLGKAPGDSASMELKKRFEELLKQAINKWILVIFAAGNYALDVDIKEIYPTRFSTIDWVISVGAHDYGLIAPYSNYSSKYIGISAPWIVISSAGRTPNNLPYILSAGTSFAWPLVAGAASRIIQILKSKNLIYTPADIENILYNSSDISTNPNEKPLLSRFLNLNTIAHTVDNIEQNNFPIWAHVPYWVTSPVLDSSELFRQKISSQVLPFIDESGNDKDKVPGMVVGIITKDFTGTFGFGTKNIETKQQPDGDTPYSIGSITKIFTSFILADEVVRWNLRLNESTETLIRWNLKEILPWVLTFKNLVTHTSGLKSMPENLTTNRENWLDWYIWWSPARNYSRLDLMNCLLNGKCIPQPNKIWFYSYSNLWIAILGMTLQDTLGFSSFNEMIQSRITIPLNMWDTGVGTPDFLMKINSWSMNGYGMNNGILVSTPYTDMGDMSPAGWIISTANDLLKFLSVLIWLNQEWFNKTVQLMMEPLVKIDDTKMVGYALTIEWANTNSPIYLKTGATPGFSSFIIWKNNPQIWIIILANRAGFDNTILPKIARSLMSDL